MKGPVLLKWYRYRTRMVPVPVEYNAVVLTLLLYGTIRYIEPTQCASFVSFRGSIETYERDTKVSKTNKKLNYHGETVSFLTLCHFGGLLRHTQAHVTAVNGGARQKFQCMRGSAKHTVAAQHSVIYTNST